MSTALNDSHVRPMPLPEPPVVAARRTPRPTPGFWGALGWLLVWFLVCAFLPFFVAGVIAGVLQRQWTEFAEAALLSGQAMGAALAVLLMYRKAGGEWVSEFGLNRLPVAQTLLAVLCVPGIKVALVGLSLGLEALLGLADPAKEMVQQAATSAPWWLSVLAIAVGPAVNEELWFRGYLGRGLVGRYGPAMGILLSSLLFGLAHLHPIQGAYAVAMGLWLHLAYRATRSLWVPVIVHLLNNGISVAAGVALSGGAEPSAPLAPATVYGFCAAAVTVAVAASVGMWAMRPRAAR